MEARPEALAPLQLRLDRRLDRVDQELARTAQDYDETRKARADHYGEMDQQTQKLEAEVQQLQTQLEPVVFEQQPAPKNFAQLKERYLEVQQQLAKTRQARRISFGATLNPGEVPPGQPLGTMNRADTSRSEK